jgi:hypothetical protein
MARKTKPDESVKTAESSAPGAEPPPAGEDSPPGRKTDKKTFRALSAIRHDGRNYAPGGEIELALAEAGALLDAGVIK